MPTAQSATAPSPKHLPADTEYLLHSLPSPLLIVDSCHRIVFLNHSAEQWMGISAGAARQQSIHDIFSTEADLNNLLSKTQRSQETVTQHDIALSASRMEKQLASIQVSPALIKGLDACLIVMLHPRGLGGRLSQQANQKEATRQAGLMAAMLAHEIKNPLAGIRGAAQLLEDSANAEDAKLTALICREVDRIGGILEQIEFFSDAPGAEKSPLNIHEILRYSRQAVSAALPHTLEWVELFDPSLPPVMGNRAQLEQLCINLLKNAGEALKETKNPRITLHTGYESGYRFRPRPDAPYLSLPIAVTVEDNGPGIAPDLQSRVFEPFVSSKEGGRGLGLAVAAKIAADHGGALMLDAEGAHGASFRLFLPAARDNSPTQSS